MASNTNLMSCTISINQFSLTSIVSFISFHLISIDKHLDKFNGKRNLPI